MNRIITGQASGRRMTVGELRKFLESIEDAADDAPLKAKTTLLGSHLQAVTVEESLKHAASPADVLFGRERTERPARSGEKPGGQGRTSKAAKTDKTDKTDSE